MIKASLILCPAFIQNEPLFQLESSKAMSFSITKMGLVNEVVWKKTDGRTEEMVVKDYAFPVKSALISGRKLEKVACVESK